MIFNKSAIVPSMVQCFALVPKSQFAYMFPFQHSATSFLSLEVSHGGSVYIMKTGKHFTSRLTVKIFKIMLLKWFGGKCCQVAQQK